MNKEAAIDRAFKIQERKRDAEEGLAEYQAKARAVDQKTARLRALRLARDAEGGAPAPPPTKPKKRFSSSNLPTENRPSPLPRR